MLIILGIAMLIAGIMIKPTGEPVGWSFLWGLSENSTPLGKLIFFVGAVIIFVSVGNMEPMA